MSATTDDLEFSTFQRRPAYRYIRKADRLPTIAEVTGKPFSEIVARVKLFNPCGRGTWWIAAYDPDTRTAFGVVEVHGRGLARFSMAELVEMRPSAEVRGYGRFSLPLERDLGWRPVTLAELMAGGGR